MRFFDAFVPAVAAGVAIFAIYRYPITEQTAHEMRAKLEASRRVVMRYDTGADSEA